MSSSTILKVSHNSNMPSPTTTEVDTSIHATSPPKTPLYGRHVTLRPLSITDAPSLFTSLGGPSNVAVWTYIPDPPPLTLETLTSMLTWKSQSTDPLFFTVLDPSGAAVGHVSFMRIDLVHRTLEIGHLIFSSSVQRSPLTTEAIYLMIRLTFELGFRRCEWKCDAGNLPSRRAAERFGFTFEGVFRQHMIVKGRNRDTAWFAILDWEWEGWVRKGMELWLDEGNFAEDGVQRRGLRECREEARREVEGKENREE